MLLRGLPKPGVLRTRTCQTRGIQPIGRPVLAPLCVLNKARAATPATEQTTNTNNEDASTSSQDVHNTNPHLSERSPSPSPSPQPQSGVSAINGSGGLSSMEEEFVEGSVAPMRGIWTDDVPSTLTAAIADTTISPTATGSGSAVDEENTPEGLADVELTSVAPGEDWFREKDDLITISTAVVVGAVVAASVFTFDVSIQYIHDLPDILAKDFGIGGGRATGFQIGDLSIPFRCIMPVGAGVAVAALQFWGFSPPLKFLTRAIEGVVDDRKNSELPQSYGPVFRKAAASAITLGSGASLGPEAPSVELGANTAAVLAPRHLSKRRKRMLVAAGAAAGVTAAFDAPVAGVLFAIEFVLKSSRLGLDRLSTSTVFVGASVAAGVEGYLRTQGQLLGLKGAASHLVGRIPYFSINGNLIYDVLQFSALGVGCAVAAVALYEGVRVSEIALRPLPRYLSAPLAGALCGAIALSFPQVQYGYVNLEEIFRDSTHMSAGSLLGLLVAKIAATSLCVGGGLVGGLFAPSLFLGALVGDMMGHVVGPSSGVVDMTSYVVVGAAAVLGAACRAPLTAMALMVEITRDTGLLVPLLAAIGIASLITDYLEGAFSKRVEALLIEQYLREKALFWGAAAAESLMASEKKQDPYSDTVESVMNTTTNMYVRHTLPLEQARTAMTERATKAAVVVDDNFRVMGVVYLPEVEDEIVRRRDQTKPDANFNRPT
uniref:Chloride channel protein n=1 Tax=Chlamydomonas leiostraca TaxID=1034604 RepID=A0A7S0RZ83_9CHLO|mmetsp:Transcript_35270/g.89248  ORF Transcript_35270/g.89248 Transcript_35270/m.89248 type:complete len:717 (+) Transcript_35270:215-2365(+)